MQEVVQTRDLNPRPQRGGITRSRLLWAAAAVLFVLDRALKALALYRGEGAGKEDAIFAFELFMNSGTVFSLPVPKGIIIGVSAVLLVIFSAALARSIRRRTVAAPALALIVAGAISNFADRLTHGAVIDYLLFFDTSAVNVADGMIMLGVLVLLAMERRGGEDPAKIT